jgi:hypothetical protein
MPLDVLGRTRATLMHASSLQPWLISLGNLCNLHRAGDRWLELFIFNEEFLVNASHQLALITSLPFVHTARRYYRLNGLVSFTDCCICGSPLMQWEVNQTCSFRGSKSRNKVDTSASLLNDLSVLLSLSLARVVWFICWSLSGLLFGRCPERLKNNYWRLNASRNLSSLTRSSSLCNTA